MAICTCSNRASLFLDEEYADEAPARSMRLHLGFEARLHFGLAHFAEIVTHRNGAEPDRGVGVRLAEMAALVVGDLVLPRRIEFGEVVRQQGLREVAVVELLAGAALNLRPCRVHDLPSIGGEFAAGAGSTKSFFHLLEGD